MEISKSKIQDAVETAEIEEIMLLYVQLRVLQPVYNNDMTALNLKIVISLQSRSFWQIESMIDEIKY